MFLECPEKCRPKPLAHEPVVAGWLPNDAGEVVDGRPASSGPEKLFGIKQWNKKEACEHVSAEKRQPHTRADCEAESPRAACELQPGWGLVWLPWIEKHTQLGEIFV